ncbi:MAG: hypothetical protein ACOH2H_12685 [Cypionkella sp.]
MGRLEPLTESGEFTATSCAERGESMQLATFGRRFDLSCNLIVNDDLNLSDNVTVFHASCDNVAAGTALDVDGIAAARQIMRSRTADHAQPHRPCRQDSDQCHAPFPACRPRPRNGR